MPAFHRGGLRDIALLAPALIIALSVPHPLGGGWVNWVLPGAVLLGASGVWFWMRSSANGGHWLDQLGRERDNVPTACSENGVSNHVRNLVGAGMVGVFALMLATAACFWPASRTLGTPPLLLEATAVILLVPLAEELYFRGAWLAILRAKLGAIASTLVVSIVFGLLHRGQGQLLFMLLASCALCALTLWTRTILWAVAVHAVWNALTLVVRLPPGTGRLGVAAAVTVVALVAIVWQLSRAKPG